MLKKKSMFILQKPGGYIIKLVIVIIWIYPFSKPTKTNFRNCAIIPEDDIMHVLSVQKAE